MMDSFLRIGNDFTFLAGFTKDRQLQFMSPTPSKGFVFERLTDGR